tara:strand:- start:449 stop:712 length:264 start_codon:yes stop_codon:yes gene_type:complete
LYLTIGQFQKKHSIWGYIIGPPKLTLEVSGLRGFCLGAGAKNPKHFLATDVLDAFSQKKLVAIIAWANSAGQERDDDNLIATTNERD